MVIKNSITLIDVNQLIPSETNPRRTFFPEQTRELANSIKEVDFIHPLTVRAHKQQGKFEIICGERRFKASLLLNIEKIPCIIRVLNDDECFDLQISENLSREPVPPLEEGEALHYLHVSQKKTVEQLSKSLGKSLSYIYDRIKLTDLIDELKTMLRFDELNVSAAIFLSKLPDTVQHSIIQTFNIDADENYIIPPLNELRTIIRRGFMLFLKDAPFDITDEQLLKIGSCVSCQFNTACNISLFPELEHSARCANPSCYEKKVQSFVDKRTAEYKEANSSEFYICDTVERSAMYENIFSKVYYADEFTYEAEPGHNVKLGLVINADSSDFMTERFVRLKNKPAEQLFIQDAQHKGSNSEALSAEHDVSKMYADTSSSYLLGNWDALMKAELSDLFNNDNDNSNIQEFISRLSIYHLGKQNIIRSVNLLEKNGVTIDTLNPAEWNTEPYSKLKLIWKSIVFNENEKGIKKNELNIAINVLIVENLNAAEFIDAGIIKFAMQTD